MSFLKSSRRSCWTLCTSMSPGYTSWRSEASRRWSAASRSPKPSLLPSLPTRTKRSVPASITANVASPQTLVQVPKFVLFCPQITALKIKHNPFAKAFLDAKERYIQEAPTPCQMICSTIWQQMFWHYFWLQERPQRCPRSQHRQSAVGLLSTWVFQLFSDSPAQIAITGAPCVFVCCKASILFFWSSAVGGWFLPGQAPICPSSSPPQFSSTAGHSSGSYCERYSSLRSHRAAPYPSHYSHRTSSTSRELDARQIDDSGQQLRGKRGIWC